MSKPDYLKTSLNIAIVGAGIAGIATALQLSKLGHKVKVFEKKQQLQELGAGIQLSPNATSIIKQWGLFEEIKASSFTPEGAKFSHWKRAYTIANFPLQSIDATQQSDYLHVHRADLHKVLHHALLQLNTAAILSDCEVTQVIESEDACLVTYKNSRSEELSEPFDYLIGADGIHSIIKKQLFPNASPPNFTGNIAWRGLIPTKNLSYKPEPKAHLIMAPNAHLVFYYVKGGEYLNYVAVKEVKKSLRSELKESWAEKGSMEELLNDFKDWHPKYKSILAQTNPKQCFSWSLYDRDPLKTWSSPRSLLIGDAAHPVLPFLAQGAAMAIEDAQVLSNLFKERVEHLSKRSLKQNLNNIESTVSNGSNNLENIGRDFYKIRSQRCEKVLNQSRNNMHIYHETNILKREIRDLGLTVIAKVFPSFLNRKLSWLYEERL